MTSQATAHGMLYSGVEVQSCIPYIPSDKEIMPDDDDWKPGPTFPFPASIGQTGPGVAKVKPDFTLVEVIVEKEDEDHLLLEWVTRSAGFGQYYFKVDENGRVYVDNEAMGQRFVRAALEFVMRDKPEAEWPQIVRKFGGIDALFAVAYPAHGEW